MKPREAQPIYLVSSEGRFWQIVSEPVWVNWQADYRNVLYTAAREVQPVNIEKEDDSEIACISCGLTLGESRLIMSHAERADAAPKLSAKQDFESVWEKARAMDETTKTMSRFIWDSAQSAEREAQPVGPRTTLNYDGTFDTTCAHCGGNGCFACLKSAAHTPERADAGKEK